MLKRSMSAGLAGLFVLTAQAQDAVEIVEVVGQTPLGAGVDADKIASNVQHVTGEMIRAQHLLDLSQLMRRNLGSVFVNEAQNNPLQPDLQYRGFVGSPLLGLPQGLAIYQDGVRLNEPFGDTVNWALIPDSAIDSVYLMPGSNPLFGLNAIGGSIAIETRDGFSNPGASAELFGGSFGRAGLQASTGDSTERLGYFVTGEYLEEDGWRDFSPTESLQLFGKLGWRTDRTGIDLGLSLAETDLIGNGASPIELLAIDRAAIFTRPDRTENELALLNLSFDHEVSEDFSLTGNAYLRSSDIVTYNGDDSDFEECEDTPGFICEEEDGEEEIVVDENDDPIPAGEALEGATVNRTNTSQSGMGFGIQGNWTLDLGGRENLLVVGLVFDSGSIDFDAGTELGALDATRLAVPGGVYVGESFTELGVDTSNLGLFVANTFTLTEQVALTVSGRYNGTEVTLNDRLGTELNGDHSFDRFNPAIGLTAALTDAVTVYAGYSESSRAPSPVELTCADEDDPCRLPNAFLADPPLEQVVAETFEAGIRGTAASIDWHAGFFQTTSRDDILFISAGALTNEGYFDNIGETRRDGIELNLTGGAGESIRWFANFTWLDATFRESLAILSPNNPASVDGEVMVRPGDRLPLIPRHLLKAGFELPLGDRFSIGTDLYASSGFHLRGDEGNDLSEIGQLAALNVRGEYRINDRLTVFMSVDNLLDREYETFGLFGEADEVLGDEFEDSRFLGPAAPRAGWVGVHVEL
jgi:outer membrane receptor protein involved in Fe transport